MMRDYDRLASLFTLDGALRMPNTPVELAGQEEMRALGRAGAGPCGLPGAVVAKTRGGGSIHLTPRSAPGWLGAG
jgi:hypothetical protein